MTEEKNPKINTIKRTKKSWRSTRFVFFILFVFLLTALSSIISERYLFPYLATSSWSGKFKILRKGSENIVVVNKTEQVNVSEEKTIADYTSQSASSVVEIISKKIGAKNTYLEDEKNGKIGSGVIVTADGMIATFKEAIFDKDADYRIILSDGNAHGAHLVTVDPFSELAFLKIDDVSNLPMVSFIAPEDIKVGTRAIIMGKDGFDSQSIFKLSLLSKMAKNFSIAGPLSSSEKLQGVFFLENNLDQEKDQNLVGAEVVDYNGDMMGIVGMKKDSDGNGTFFVIPVNHIQYLIDQLLTKGAVKRAHLGVYYLALTKENSFFSGSNLEKGALVYSPSLQQGLSVILGSSAEKAGIKIMDVITSVNGEEVNPGQNLAFLISKYKPGDTVTMKVLRDGKEMEVKAVLQ